MKPAAAGSFVVLFASALFAGSVAVTPGNLSGGVAMAASIDSAYDMDRLLNEPHPLAREYGTRWQPAPVQPRPPSQPAASPPPAAAARSISMPPPAPPVAIPPPALLPTAAPAAPTAQPAAPTITPNLTLDDSGTAKSPAPPPAAPPPKVAATAPPSPPPSPPSAPAPRSGQQTSADAGVSRYRVGGGSPRAKPEGLGWLSEVRVGALAHDQGPFSHNKEDGAAANFELLFNSPGFLKYIWSPRPHLGLDITTNGTTNDAYFGLSYEWEFWRYMFGGFSLGGAVHDGFNTNAPLGRKELGCKLLFRESIEIGFRFAERHSISGFLDHISNAKICSTNEGLENAGIRYGYKF